jgi:acyl-CoA hydrolase
MRTSLLRPLRASTPRLPPTLLASRRTFYTDKDTLEPFHPIPNREPAEGTADEAIQNSIFSGNRVFIHSAAMCPAPLVNAMIQSGESGRIRDVDILHIHTEGPAGYGDAKYTDAGIFRPNSLFTGANIRKSLNAGNTDFTPIFLREIPLLFRKNILPVDVALISVSPADKHGYHSLGTSIDVARSAIQSAKVIVALENDQVPRTFGDGFIHRSHFNYVVKQSIPLPARKEEVLGDVERKIGEHIADNLVDDGACLQMGIGKIPDAVLARLREHKNLGIHTEMLSDGILDLVDRGVITNAKKAIHPGNIVTGFAVGSRKLYDFVHDNPFVRFLDIAYVNNPTVIGRNSKVTAINSLIEVREHLCNFPN